jgi:hypothetical protein
MGEEMERGKFLTTFVIVATITQKSQLFFPEHF